MGLWPEKGKNADVIFRLTDLICFFLSHSLKNSSTFTDIASRPAQKLFLAWQINIATRSVKAKWLRRMLPLPTRTSGYDQLAVLFFTQCLITFHDNSSLVALPMTESLQGLERLCWDLTVSPTRDLPAPMWTHLALLQPLRWCCVDCVIHHEFTMIHHERDAREEQHHTCMWRERAIIEWSWHVNSIVACCHSALRKCRSGFPIATAPTPG